MLVAFKTISMASVMLWLTHLLSCAWYWIGSQDQAAEGNVPAMPGWVAGGGGGIWSSNSTLYTYYLLAFHSVNPKLANVGDGVQTAQTNMELLFSIIAELVAMIVFVSATRHFPPPTAVFLPFGQQRSERSLPRCHPSSEHQFHILSCHLCS